MLNSTTIRRSPLSLIRNFVVIEIIAILLFILVSRPGDVEYELYSQSFFAEFMSYTTAKFLLLSGMQFCITIVVFLRWYYSGQVFNKKPDIKELINKEENEKLEFKSSLRFDHKLSKPNRDVEKAAMKSVAAFLNSNGGQLVIGFDDKKQPLGLHYDYKTLQRQDSDGFENHFTQVFNSMIGPEHRQLVKLWFYKDKGSETAVIEAASSPKPVYLKANNNEHFYVRTGNIVTDLKLSEVDKYIRTRWPKY